ncbi:MAG: uroporphyrinogen-III C-methyltransferase [Elusimicrobiota bacterium]
MADAAQGVVYLIGAGPGDPELITVKGKRLLETCDAVIYDNLVANEFVLALPEAAEKHYVGKRAGHHCFSQDEINKLLVKLGKEGKRVARLKGGDPFVFGRGSEEARFLKQHGVRFEVVSGVTSGVAALAYNGIPCTDRSKSSFVVFATGHKAGEKRESSVPWGWIAQARRGTVVIYMGIGEMEAIVDQLLTGGMPPETPAAVIERGTFPSQRVVQAELAELPKKTRAAGLRPPAIIVIGDVVSLQSELEWYEKRPLSGIRVMITRIAGQAREMRDSLRDLGAEILSYPTLAVETHDDAEGWRSFDRIGSGGKWLVFTSSNAVRFFIRRFVERRGDIRQLAGFKIAAAGASTVQALRDLHLETDFAPAMATVDTLSARMLEELDLKGAEVVRVRGNLAASTIEDRFEAAGVRVTPLTVYQTHNPVWPDGLKSKLFDHPPQVLVFTSGSSVEGLFSNLTEDEVRTLTAGAVIASIGPMTSSALQARGLTVTLETKKLTVPDLIKSIADLHKK